jgi:hypothetical protein
MRAGAGAGRRAFTTAFSTSSLRSRNSHASVAVSHASASAPSAVRSRANACDQGEHTAAQHRRALTHLVRAHARKRFKTYMVRNHLRGEHRCQWAGLDVRLLPSQYDAETSVPGALHERLQMDGMLRYV